MTVKLFTCKYKQVAVYLQYAFSIAFILSPSSAKIMPRRSRPPGDSAEPRIDKPLPFRQIGHFSAAGNGVCIEMLQMGCHTLVDRSEADSTPTGPDHSETAIIVIVRFYGRSAAEPEPSSFDNRLTERHIAAQSITAAHLNIGLGYRLIEFRIMPAHKSSHPLRVDSHIAADRKRVRHNVEIHAADSFLDCHIEKIRLSVCNRPDTQQNDPNKQRPCPTVNHISEIYKLSHYKDKPFSPHHHNFTIKKTARSDLSVPSDLSDNVRSV